MSIWTCWVTKVDQNQFFAVRGRDPVYGVASVQIQEFGKARLDGKAAPQGRLYVIRREGHDSCVRTSDGAGQGIEEIGRVVVDPEGGIELVFEAVPKHRHLIHVVGSGGFEVHLLNEVEIRIEGMELVHYGLHVFDGGFLGEGTGILPSIHKETELVGVGCETDVPVRQIVGQRRIHIH